MENRDRQVIHRFRREFAELREERGDWRAKLVIARKVRKLLKKREMYKTC